jgi:hypothetical protein
MSDFKGRRFPTDLILLCVRWYCKFGISYRDLEEMMGERGVAVDHTTLFRWVQRVEALHAYIAASDIAEDRKGWLFRTSRGHNATVLSGQPMNQSDAWRMIRQRATPPEFTRRSAIVPSARPASPLTLPTAERWSMRRKWRRTKARAPPSSMTGPRSGSLRTRWRGSGCEPPR